LASGRKLEVNAMCASVDEQRCSGCRVCGQVCPYRAITHDEGSGRAEVNALLCHGCGTCVAACPANALSANHFTNDQIPGARFSPYGPSILNWLPLPNVSGNPNFNYQSQAANSSPSFDQVYRGDYNINDKWRLFVRGLDSKCFFKALPGGLVLTQRAQRATAIVESVGILRLQQ